MQIKGNISLKEFNTFGIEVSAKYFASFRSERMLQELLSQPLLSIYTPLILGGGSNILFTKDVDTIVMKNEIEGIELISQDEDYFYVKAGAGVNWHSFVMYCLDHNYAGVENLALIPGNVGATPMQNIGAYGVEIKEVFHSLEAMHIKDKALVVMSNKDCSFGYRESIFKHKYKNQFVITSVTYKLKKEVEFNISYGSVAKELEMMGVKELSIRSVAQAVINIRSSKLPNPKIIGNAGSFFKNPEISLAQYEELKIKFPSIVGYTTEKDNVKIAAGWLIEQCGWKGFREGDVGCHEKQALVLVNFAKATGAGIYNLSERIIESVFQQFQIRLEREVNIY